MRDMEFKKLQFMRFRSLTFHFRARDAKMQLWQLLYCVSATLPFPLLFPFRSLPSPFLNHFSIPIVIPSIA